MEGEYDFLFKIVLIGKILSFVLNYSVFFLYD